LLLNVLTRIGGHVGTIADRKDTIKFLIFKKFSTHL